MKIIHLFSLLAILSSCDLRESYSDKVIKEFHCPDSEELIIGIEGYLTLDSKGIPFVDFVDTVYNGKVKLVGEGYYENIYQNYDSFLALKDIDDNDFNISVYGHYVTPVDTTNWLTKRRDFHIHSITYLF